MYCQSLLQQAGEKFNLTQNERDNLRGIRAESENMKKIFVRH